MTSYYLIRFHGEHGFTSNGVKWSTLEAATEHARYMFAQNEHILGAEIRHDGKTVAKVFPGKPLEVLER